MRVLLVEDYSKIAGFIKKGLMEAGFIVDVAADGETGLHMAETRAYDVAVIDIMLPKLDGLSLIQQMRSQKIFTPVLVLSARHTLDDRVMGLESGADDYLVKPFFFTELLARIQALLRRGHEFVEPMKLTFHDITMDLLKREVRRGGELVDLQPREFALLEFFLRNPERVISRTMILERVWNYDFDPQTNVVDVLVSRLRNKLDRGFSKKLIHTVRGFGYVLRVQS